MNKNQVVDIGIYEYSLPTFRKPVFVTVFVQNDELYVEYGEGYAPSSMDEIPENAVFSRWI